MKIETIGRLPHDTFIPRSGSGQTRVESLDAIGPMFLVGALPKKRLHSLLNCERLDKPTRLTRSIAKFLVRQNAPSVDFDSSSSLRM